MFLWSKSYPDQLPRLQIQEEPKTLAVTKQNLIIYGGTQCQEGVAPETGIHTVNMQVGIIRKWI